MNILIGTLLTGGLDFIKAWWKGKKEETQKELEIKQEEKRTDQKIRMENATAGIKQDTSRIKQMANSIKDEIVMIVFYLPLVLMFTSPVVDLWMLKGEYQQGMLAEAAAQGLNNLTEAPMWYQFIVVILAMLSWGYSKGIDQLLSLIKRK